MDRTGMGGANNVDELDDNSLTACTLQTSYHGTAGRCVRPSSVQSCEAGQHA